MNDRNVALDPWRGVHHAIRDSIIAGEYLPGTRLVEQHLADRFGTSRGPVRTALRELERSGLVVSIDRRGTFVRSVSDNDIEELFSLWDLLWGFAVRRAASRIGPDERRWLEEFRAREVPVDPEAHHAHTIEFTRQVFRMAHHNRALEIYESLLIQAQPSSLFLVATKGGRGPQWSRDYGPICDALISGNAEAVISESEARIKELREFWLGCAQGPNADQGMADMNSGTPDPRAKP